MNSGGTVMKKWPIIVLCAALALLGERGCGHAQPLGGLRQRLLRLF